MEEEGESHGKMPAAENRPFVHLDWYFHSYGQHASNVSSGYEIFHPLPLENVALEMMDSAPDTCMPRQAPASDAEGPGAISSNCLGILTILLKNLAQLPDAKSDHLTT